MRHPPGYNAMNGIIGMCVFGLTTMMMHGTSIVFPTYSTPLVSDGTLIVLSPDRMTLLGVTTGGKRKWTQRLTSRGALFKHKSGSLLLAAGSCVRKVDPADGLTSPLFDAGPPVADLRYLETADLFCGESETAGVPTLALFDGSTHASLLRERHAESVVYADDDLMVLTKGKRKREDGGYSITKVWLEAFSRSTGKRVWSADFVNRSWPYPSMVRIGAHLVCDDGDDLVVIHAGSGELRRKPADKPADSIGPSGLRNEKGVLVYVTSELNMNDFNRSKQTVYRVSVPELRTLETKVLEVIEAARVETAGEFLISDSLYRTACFRRDGSKVWEHFQMHRTDVINGLIYFSDYDDGVARLSSIEVATGRERILISEPVDAKTSKPTEPAVKTPRSNKRPHAGSAARHR